MPAKNLTACDESSGAWGSVVVKTGRSLDLFPVVSLGIFFVDPDGTMCPGDDSASENENQGFLLG